MLRRSSTVSVLGWIWHVGSVGSSIHRWRIAPSSWILPYRRAGVNVAGGTSGVVVGIPAGRLGGTQDCSEGAILMYQYCMPMIRMISLGYRSDDGLVCAIYSRYIFGIKDLVEL